MHRNYRFLLVDDDEDSRFLVRHSLVKSFPSARVVECISMEDALSAVRSGTFDGIITDHHLRSFDAAALIRELRKSDARCPILMTTASCDPRLVRQAREAGASQVFADGSYNFTAFLHTALDSCAREDDSLDSLEAC